MTQTHRTTSIHREEVFEEHVVSSLTYGLVIIRDTPSFSRLKVLKASDKYRIVTIFSTKTVDFDNK